MFVNKVEVLNMARAMAVHASARQGVIARNVANADTPGYRARDLTSFADVWDSQGTALRTTRAGHVGGTAQASVGLMPDRLHASPNGNSVSLEAEMVKAAETRQAHDMALAIYSSLSGNIRATLGRR
ncbi:FlgB family protein [Gemmobacter nectariphilus]|uniref:FlgB family protein n=1 Tax=Gemmobacter nectariphilus TaxID=220343 RepID=UPI0004062C8B|nr:FlgB family protein [Gemmobacter nectariphilus]